MQPISIIIVLLCGFTSFNSTPSNVAGAMSSYEFRRLYYSALYYYRSPYFTSYRYTKYRAPYMNRLKMYQRAYSSSYYFGEAAIYHRMYSYAARMTGYFPLLTFSDLSRKCGNFETNGYGDFLGFFDCPLFFEPRNFTYCCGLKESHYCCSQSWRSNPYKSDPNLGSQPTTAPPSSTIKVTVFMFGVILACGVAIAIFALCLYCCLADTKPSSRPVAAAGSTTSVTTDLGPGGSPPRSASDPTGPATYPRQTYVMQPIVADAPPSYDDACHPPGADEPSGDAPPPYTPAQSPPYQLTPQ